jgi:hypothetical protein
VRESHLRRMKITQVMYPIRRKSRTSGSAPSRMPHRLSRPKKTISAPNRRGCGLCTGEVAPQAGSRQGRKHPHAGESGCVRSCRPPCLHGNTGISRWQGACRSAVAEPHPHAGRYSSALCARVHG